MNNFSINGVNYSLPNNADITIKNGSVIINGMKMVDLPNTQTVTITINGNVGDFSCEGSAIVNGDVQGDVSVAGSLNCKNIGGDVSCAGSIHYGGR